MRDLNRGTMIVWSVCRNNLETVRDSQYAAITWKRCETGHLAYELETSLYRVMHDVFQII